MGERIRIIDTPPGQAPEWVRNQWVGLILPVAEDPLKDGIQLGARGGRPENLGGYPINTTEALNALVEKSPKAAEWWVMHINPRSVPQLVFRRDVCEIVPEENTQS